MELLYLCKQCLHGATNVNISLKCQTWAYFFPTAGAVAFAIAAAAVVDEQMVCFVGWTCPIRTFYICSCTDHYIQPCHSAGPPPNLS